MKGESILVATDFGPHSAEAITYAARFAQASGATLHLMHARQTPVYMFMEASFTPPPDLVAKQLEFCEQRLAADAKLAAELGAEVQTAVREGIAHQEIGRYASELGAGLIVVGTHGRSGAGRVFWGSVVERVLKTSKTPVIVVPAGCAERLPFRILIAHDFSKAATAAAQVARTIHGVIGGPIHLAHVYLDVWAEYTDRGIVADDAANVRREALRTGLMQMLSKEADALFSIDSEGVQTHLLNGDPAEALMALAEEVRADLVCVGATGKTGIEKYLLGSVAYRLMEKLPVPLLVTQAE